MDPVDEVEAVDPKRDEGAHTCFVTREWPSDGISRISVTLSLSQSLSHSLDLSILSLSSTFPFWTSNPIGGIFLSPSLPPYIPFYSSSSSRSSRAPSAKPVFCIEFDHF